VQSEKAGLLERALRDWAQAVEWRLQASTLLEGYSRWPGRRQVLKMERTVSNKRTGEVRRETAYAITSLGPEQALAVELIKRHLKARALTLPE